jgi:hypothetical protein
MHKKGALAQYSAHPALTPCSAFLRKQEYGDLGLLPLRPRLREDNKFICAHMA